MWTKQDGHKPKSPGTDRNKEYEEGLVSAGIARKPFWVPKGMAELLLRRIAAEMKRRHLAAEPQIHEAAVEALLSSIPPKDGEKRIAPRLDEQQLALLQEKLDDKGRETIDRVAYLITNSPPAVFQRLISHVSAVEALLGHAMPRDTLKC